MDALKKLLDEVRSKPWIWGVLLLIVALGIFA